MEDLFNYDGRAEAFDALIAMHDVSDAAIDRLYDQRPDPVSPVDIAYAMIFGDVVAADMPKFLERQAVRREEMRKNAEWYKEIRERSEEHEREKEKKKWAKIRKKFTMTEQPTISIIPKKPKAMKPDKDPEQMHLEKITSEVRGLLCRIPHWCDEKRKDVLSMDAKASTAVRITGVSHAFRRIDVLNYLQDLRHGFEEGGQYWKEAIDAIFTDPDAGTSYPLMVISRYKSPVKSAVTDYLKRMRNNEKNARSLAIGTHDDQIRVYTAYTALTNRTDKKMPLYVMKVMCELFGDPATDYNPDSGVLTIECTQQNYFPTNFKEMHPRDYRTALSVIWATNKINKYGYTIQDRSIDGWFDERLSDSDMVYISHGLMMHWDRIGYLKRVPKIRIRFKSNSGFVEACKTIYQNETQMRELMARSVVMKNFFMDRYFHFRNLDYARFLYTSDSWTVLAKRIAILSTDILKESEQ